MMSPHSIGFIGLGNMGWPMAANLVRSGFRLVVRDADPERERTFAREHGCEIADSPASFGEVAAVVTMLPDDRAVREVILDWEGGIAPALPTSAVVVDMSSSHPAATRSLGTSLARYGLELVDAPVSGGVTRAKEGTLSLMVGGDDSAVDRVAPVLEVLGARTFRTGTLGTGHAMKALNNYVGASAYLAAAEALAIGRQSGLDPAVMVEVMNSSTGRSFNTEHVMKEEVLTGRYGTGFALGLIAKDVGIAASLAEGCGVDAPGCELVRTRWADAAASLGSAVDHSLAHRHWWSIDLSDESKHTGD